MLNQPYFGILILSLITIIIHFFIWSKIKKDEAWIVPYIFGVGGFGGMTLLAIVETLRKL
jgi:hypothetical protein